MPGVTLDRFLDDLARSNLLTAEQMQTARVELATADDEQLPGIVERIVERGWLTGWQAQMLLSGHRAFFLGRYKLLDHLGEGGMGSVFKAEQTPLGRTVAIKLISKRRVPKPTGRGPWDSEAAARFRREIQAAAALSHPHIVSAYDADAVAGRHFLVMEYVAGRDLGAIVKGGRKLLIGEACEYVRQAALGLEHAHQRGMIHRDLKPSNLLLRAEGREQRALESDSGSSPSALRSPLVKILDMGLARIEPDSESPAPNEQTELTHTGQIVGTPDYISPEQARDSKAADARSDIYSLGCTLFRLLSGRVPFEGDGAMAKLMARISDDPPPLRSVLPEAPPELETVLLKMMAREPAERYQSAGEVVAALAPFAELPVTPAYIAETIRPAPYDAATASIEPDSQSPAPPAIDAGLNEFLQNLETAAAREEEILSTGDLGQTLASGGRQPPVASEQPNASDPAAQQPAHAGRSPQMTRAGKKLQAEIAARTRAERRRLMLIVTAIVLLIAVVVGLRQWYQAGETQLIIDWPRDDLQSVTLTEGGRQRQFANKGELQYRGRPGTYRIKLQRDGYEPIDETITLDRAEIEKYRPQWIPNAATRRKIELADVQRRTDEVLAHLAPRDSRGANSPDVDNLVNDPQIAQLRNDLLAFRNKHSGTAESVGAATIMSLLPWPADQLKREDTGPYELTAAEMASDGRQPSVSNQPPAAGRRPLAELVAVLGDSRLKHWGGVTGIAFSGDGKTLYSIGAQDGIRLWDPRSGRLQQTLGMDVGGGTAIAVSPDGKSIAAYQANAVLVWIAESGEQRVRINTHTKATKPIYDMAFSPDGKTLATGIGGFGTVLWDAASGEEKLSIPGSYFRAFSPNGRQIVTDDAGGAVTLRDLSSGAVTTRLQGHKAAAGRVACAAFAADGKTLATASGQLCLWKPETGEKTRMLDQPGEYVTRVAWDPTLPRLASGGLAGNQTGWISIWNTESGTRLHHFQAHLPAVRELTFSPDGRTLASTGDEGQIKLWDVATGQETIKTGNHQRSVNSIAVSPDGTMLASGGDDATLRLWDGATGRERRKLTGHDGTVWSVAFSPDARSLASTGADSMVKLWETESGRLRWTMTRYTRMETSVAFSPDGGTLCAGGGSQNIWQWDADTGEGRGSVAKLKSNVFSVAFSPDGRSLVSASGEIKLWDMETGRERIKTMEHPGLIYSVIFSPDGGTIASGSSDQTIKLWNTETGRELPTLTGHEAEVLSVAFSPDGRYLASSGNDGTVRLWDAVLKFENLRKTFHLAPPGCAIHQVVFTPDGRHLVTANGNGTVYVLRMKEWSPTMGAESVGTTGAERDDKAGTERDSKQ